MFFYSVCSGIERVRLFVSGSRLVRPSVSVSHVVSGGSEVIISALCMERNGRDETKSIKKHEGMLFSEKVNLT